MAHVHCVRIVPLDHAGLCYKLAVRWYIYSCVYSAECDEERERNAVCHQSSLMTSNIYCVSKKGPTCKLSVTSSNLNRFSFFCTAGKRIKFATKPIRNYAPHLRYVATLPWEIRNSNFLQTWKKMQKVHF